MLNSANSVGAGLGRRELLVGAGSAGLAALGGATLAPRDAHAAGEDAYGGAFLGAAVSAGGVGNTTFKYGAPHSYRFRAEKTGYVTGIRWWNRFNMGDSGYSSGDGGVIRLEVQTDSAGLPSGRVLGLTGSMPGIAIGRFPKATMATPAFLVAGQVYHIVFVQLSSSGAFTSVNDLHFFAPVAATSPRTMYWGNDLTSLSHRFGRWQLRADRHPIFELHYSDGAIKGQGFMNAGRRDTKTVSATGQVRQQLRAAASKTTTQVSFRCWKTASGGGLYALLESPQGDRLATAYATSDEISTSSGDRAGASSVAWVTKAWDRPVALEAGQTYRVRFQAAGNNFGFIALQKGWAWGFGEDKMQPKSLTTCGQYSTTAGRSWSGWTMYGRGNRDDLDIPVLLALA